MQVSLRGTTDSAFGIGQDIALPPAAVDLFEAEWFDALENLGNGGSAEGDKVRIAAHEADRAAIHHDLNDVPCEERAAPVRSARPMQNGSTIEMSPAVDERHPIPQLVGRSFPELKLWIIAHDPLTVGRVQVDGRAVEDAAPSDHG